MSQPAPLPYRFEELGIHDGTGSHIYLVDATGRKVGVVWGKREEKPYTAQLLLAGANHIEEAVKAMERMLGFLSDANSWDNEAEALLNKIKDALK